MLLGMSAPITAPRCRGQLLGVEVLRFLAALAVLIFHYQHFYRVGQQPVGFVQTEQPLSGLLRVVYARGFLGVELFWCLSGFIFFRNYRALVRDRAVGGWRFLVLRFSRLYPLHLATLLLVAALQVGYAAQHDGQTFVYGNNDVPHFLLQLAYAGAWPNAQDLSFNGPSWSVSVEVLVYCGFFLVLRHVSARSVVNVGVVLAWAAFAHFGVHHPWLDAFAYFYAGGLAAFVLVGVLNTRAERPVLLLATLAIPVGVVVLLQAPVPDALAYIGLATVTVYVAAAVNVPRKLGRAAQALGNLTYSSYLLHFPVQIAAMTALTAAGRPVPVERVWFLLTYLGVVLVLSALVFRWLEMPAQDALRRRFLPSSTADPSSRRDVTGNDRSPV